MYLRFIPRRPVDSLTHHPASSDSAPIDSLTGLATKQGLRSYLRLAARAGMRVTLIHLSWKGPTPPTLDQVHAVANALGSCKGDDALAVRVSDTQFVVVIQESPQSALLFLARLWRWLGPQCPLTFLLEEFPDPHAGAAQAQAA